MLASKAALDRQSHLVTAVQNEDTQALCLAVQAGNLLEISRLLEARVDPNGRDEIGETPLFEACSAGAMDICRLLMSHRAEPLLTSSSGVSALQLASSS